MAYWMNDQFFENYGKGVSIASIASYTGSQNITGNNAVYLRYRWEVNSSSATAGETWVPYAKGGDFRRWYGNIDHVVNWSDDARNFYQTNSASNLLAKRYCLSVSRQIQNWSAERPGAFCRPMSNTLLARDD